MQSESRLAAKPIPEQGLSPTRPASQRIICRQVQSPGERAEHHSIRRRIFVDEQAVFGASDVDVHDQDTATIALLGYCDGVAAGTVRLFLLDPAAGLWQGDRLAVLRKYRTRGVGAPLVRCAVATAAALGGRTMTAHIQPANTAFFQRLGWTSTGETEIYAGLPHQPMSIALPSQDEGLATVLGLAAGINGRDL